MRDCAPVEPAISMRSGNALRLRLLHSSILWVVRNRLTVTSSSASSGRRGRTDAFFNRRPTGDGSETQADEHPMGRKLPARDPRPRDCAERNTSPPANPRLRELPSRRSNSRQPQQRHSHTQFGRAEAIGNSNCNFVCALGRAASFCLSSSEFTSVAVRSALVKPLVLAGMATVETQR